MKQKGFAPILILLVLFGIVGAFFLGKESNKINSLTKPLNSQHQGSVQRPKITGSPITSCPTGIPPLETLSTGAQLVKSQFRYSVISPKDWVVSNDCDNNGEFRLQFNQAQQGSYAI